MNRYRKNAAKGYAELGLLAVPVLLAIASVAAWATHIIWIISALASDAGATVGQMVLGGIGAFMPPVGAIHGLMIWLGFGL